MSDLPWIMAKRSARLGVASSQRYMGHWSPEFYEKKVRQIDAEFKAELNEQVEKQRSRMNATP